MSNQDEDIEESESGTTRPTREQIRKNSAAYSDLAEELAKGKPGQLPDPPFDAGLRQAIRDAKSMAKTARVRQIRLLARLLQDAASIEELRDARRGRTPTLQAKEAREVVNEAWRKRLMEEGDSALTEFLSEYPDADRTRLRQLVRQASKIVPNARSNKAATTLLREIRALTDAAASDCFPSSA
jgi:ribosome-associated protein